MSSKRVEILEERRVNKGPMEWKILRGEGGGVQIKESSVGEVWIFSGTTHSPSF